ncbi:MAG: YeeE/YedE family protein [Pseudomonadota bacterium]
MRSLLSFAAGLLFGLGLVVSGMSNPAKVLNFLDMFGTWDPSLAFVMGGAVLTAFIGYRLVLRRSAPLFASAFHLPLRTDIDRPLLTGAALFGIGWGLGGFCPGPSLTAISFAEPGTLAFVPAMLVGMIGAKIVRSAGSAGRSVPAE